MKSKLLVFILLVSVGLMTAACQDNSVLALDYLAALNDGDLERAAELVCPERQDEIAEGLTSVTAEERENFNFQNVTCAQRGADVSCRYTIIQEGTELGQDDTPDTFERSVVFEFENGRICGFEEQAVNEQLP